RACLDLVPTGIGPKSLREAARSRFGVEWTPEQASAYHDRTLGSFPEISLYLRDDMAERIAANLHVPVEDLMCLLSGYVPSGQVGNALAKALNYVRTTSCAPRDILRLLYGANANPELDPVFSADPLEVPRLYCGLTERDLVLPTGRVCGRS